MATALGWHRVDYDAVRGGDDGMTPSKEEIAAELERAVAETAASPGH